MNGLRRPVERASIFERRKEHDLNVRVTTSDFSRGYLLCPKYGSTGRVNGNNNGE